MSAKRRLTPTQISRELGPRLKAARAARSLSLAQLSEASGVPAATLSRIENDKMSPTFGMLSRVLIGLDVDWHDLLGPAPVVHGRGAGTGDGSTGTTTDVRGYVAQALHPHDSTRLMPLMVDVDARRLEDVGGLTGHLGQEFCFVLSGTLVLHLAGQPPQVMPCGASALFDSATPHAYLAGNADGAKILIVVLRAYGSFADVQPIELRKLST